MCKCIPLICISLITPSQPPTGSPIGIGARIMSVVMPMCVSESENGCAYTRVHR